MKVWPSWMVGCVVGLCCACGEAPDPPPSPAALPSQDDAVYVGGEVCSGCHLGVHATYVETGMSRSVEIDPAEALPEGLGDAPRVMRVGSGRHASAIFAEDAAGWTRKPVCRVAGEARWLPCPDDDAGSRHVASGPLASCLVCHAAAPRDGPPAAGVDCERCHGPGSAHAERWRNDPRRGTGGRADPTIVQPRRLDHAERMAVCLQCHLGDAETTARWAAPGTGLFRPGSRPEGGFEEPAEGGSSSDGFRVASQGARLMRSACYRAGTGRLDCLTCHDPHVTVYHEDRSEDHFRRACLGCHETGDCGASSALRDATVPADDCVRCHMPRVEPEDQRSTLYTDHWIRR